MATDNTINWPPAVTPYIIVSDGRVALEWYGKVLGATPRGEPYIMADGSLGHAEIAIDDGVVMLAEESGDVPVQAPRPGTRHSHTIHVQVDNADDVTDRAREAGAGVEREPEDQPHGRVAVFVDPFGHRWMVNQPPGSASRVRDGDVGYITMSTPDPERALQFYSAVLRWRLRAPGEPDVLPVTGLGTAADKPSVTLCYRVADLHAALRAVREQGGAAGEIEAEPYGLLAECVDNQGLLFHLWQTPGE